MTAASWQSGSATISWCLKYSVHSQRRFGRSLWLSCGFRISFSLRRDPFERADFNSNVYYDWMINHVPQLYQCQAIVAGQIANYVKYPPRQKAASFNLDCGDGLVA